MMNYYRVKKELFFNGEKIGEQYGYTMNDEDCSDISLYCGKELLQRITDFGRLPNSIQGIASWEKRILHRGYVLYGWGMNFGGIRKVLHEEDKIVYNVKYEEMMPSIQEVMEYPNGEKAIQWLKDRGITACPMINPQ